jgi:hypothetical protein
MGGCGDDGGETREKRVFFGKNGQTGVGLSGCCEMERKNQAKSHLLSMRIRVDAENENGGDNL